MSCASPSGSTNIFRDPANAKTGVFWDLGDFPIPIGLDPESVCLKIKEALDLRGEMSISAYFEDKTLPDEVLNEYRNAGIVLHPHGDKSSRLDAMIFDILLWGMDNYTDDSDHILKNLVVISRNMPGNTQFNKILLTYTCSYSDDNVVVVLPDNFTSDESTPLPDVKTYWLWKSLLDGQEPIDQSLIAPRVKREEFFDITTLDTSEPHVYCESCEY